jgi:hypothetical protein
LERIGYLKEIDIERIGRIKPVDEDEECGDKVKDKACEGRQKC